MSHVDTSRRLRAVLLIGCLIACTLLLCGCAVVETQSATDAGDGETGDTRRLGYPGDPCNDDSDCLTDICVADICRSGGVGDPCNDDGDCAGATPLCGPAETGCQAGVEGDPCADASDCAENAPFCIDDACRLGTAGNPCNDDNDCDGATPLCGPGATGCQDGVEGDPCETIADCADGAPICASTGMCQDGNGGDACSDDDDCSDPMPFCVDDDGDGPDAPECQAGIEGEPCEDENDCAPGASICSSMGICQDGTASDACSDDEDCAGETPICGPDDVGCQAGAAGDPCVENEEHCSAQAPYCWDGTCHAGRALAEECRYETECESGHCSNGHCAPEGFAYIPAGTFCMGSPDGSTECMDETPPAELGREEDETLHEVELTHPFYLQETEVTQAQWEALGFTNPSEFTECDPDTKTCPVERNNWWEAFAYANALSEAEGLTPCYTLAGCDPSAAGTDIECSGVIVGDPLAEGKPYLCEGYRLPTEAEWEYAYRAGTTTAFYNGGITNTERSPLDTILDLIGWYGGNSGVDYSPDYDCTGWYDGSTVCGTHEVGGKAANGWGLYDMSGNVWEWVWDEYQSDYYESSEPSDPVGGTGSSRVIRGGSWSNLAQRCRAAARDSDDPGVRSSNLGFRPSRSDLSHP